MQNSENDDEEIIKMKKKNSIQKCHGSREFQSLTNINISLVAGHLNSSNASTTPIDRVHSHINIYISLWMCRTWCF